MVEKLFQELSALPEVEAIALGGSRAGERFDEASDYDVYLYCTGPVSEEVRREILSRYCGHMEIGNHFWEYEDNCTLKNGIDLDILYRNLDDFVRDVAGVAEGCQARSGYTTCMWHNLRTCKIVYDRDGRLNAAKERFDVPYPEKLRENIIRQNWVLLVSAMPAYTGQIAKAAKRGDLVSVCHRTAAFLESYFDILFALNRQTHPGEKRLVQLCRDRCKVLPDGFEENLENLFQAQYRGSAGLTDALTAITDQLEKVLQDQGLGALLEWNQMRLLFTLDKKDYTADNTIFSRPSARAIIIQDGKVAMVHSIKYNYYKFPGGGIEPGESKTDAVIREALEEAGLRLLPETIRGYGYVHRIQKGDLGDTFIQDNYYYLGEADPQIVPQRLDDYEDEEHFTLEYMDPETAIGVNRNADHGPKDQLMLEREAQVLELLIREGYLPGNC